MRVIAGSLKGRRLKPPAWEGLRPTSDKLRGTLFNILASRIAGARVVDAYAGTGAMGIEAISRGASAVTFIERDARAQALIAENLAHCGIATGYTIVRADVVRAFESLGQVGLFDIVLLDPPYALDDNEHVENVEMKRALAAAGALLTADGLLILEHSRRTPPPDAVGPLVRSRDVVSGDSTLTFYEVKR